MKVPGTFKRTPTRIVRATEHEDSASRDWGRMVEGAALKNGALVAYAYFVDDCSVIVAREPVASDRSYRWHLSIAHRHRYPTWDEIKFARYSIPETAEVPLMVQLLPLVEDSGQWTNVHENCFHLYELDPEAYNLAVT